MKKRGGRRGSLLDAVPDEFDAVVTCCSKKRDERTETDIQSAINLILAKDGPFFRSLRREKLASEDTFEAGDKLSPAEKARMLIQNAKLIRIKGSEVLVRQGNVPSRKPFYLVWSGEVLLYKESEEPMDGQGIGRTSSVPLTKTTKQYHSTIDQELVKLRQHIRSANVDSKYIRFKRTLLIQQFGPKVVEQMDRFENAKIQERELARIMARERAQAAKNIREQFGIRTGFVAEGHALGEPEMIAGHAYAVSAVGRHAIAGMDEPGVATGAVVLALSLEDYSAIWPGRAEKMKACMWMMDLPLFKCFSTEDVLHLLNVGEWERHLPRRLLCSAGQPSEKVFVVYKGECRVVRRISADSVLKAASRGGKWSEAKEEEDGQEQDASKGGLAVNHRVERVLANKAVQRVAGFGGLSLSSPEADTKKRSDSALSRWQRPVASSKPREDLVQASLCSGDVEVDVSVLHAGDVFGHWGVAFPDQPEPDDVVTGSVGKCLLLTIPASELAKCEVLDHEQRALARSLKGTRTVRESQTRTAAKLRRAQVMGRIHAARMPQATDHMFPGSIWNIVAAEEEAAAHRSFVQEAPEESLPEQPSAKFMSTGEVSAFVDAGADSGAGFTALNRVVDKSFVLREYSSKGKGLGKQYNCKIPDVEHLRRPMRRAVDSEVKQVLAQRQEPTLISDKEREELDFRDPDVPMTRGTSYRDELVKSKLRQALNLFSEYRTLSRVVVVEKSVLERDKTLDLAEFLAVLHKCKLILKRGHLAGMTEGDAITLTDACSIFNRVNRGILGRSNDAHELDYDEFAETLLEIAYILSVPPPQEVVDALQQSRLVIDEQGVSAELFASIKPLAPEDPVVDVVTDKEEDDLLLKSTGMELRQRPRTQSGQRQRPKTHDASRPRSSDGKHQRPASEQRQRVSSAVTQSKSSAEVLSLDLEEELSAGWEKRGQLDKQRSETDVLRLPSAEDDIAEREELVLDWNGGQQPDPIMIPRSKSADPSRPLKLKVPNKKWASPFEKYLNKRPQSSKADSVHVGIQMVAPAPTATRPRPVTAQPPKQSPPEKPAGPSHFMASYMAPRLSRPPPRERLKLRSPLDPLGPHKIPFSPMQVLGPLAQMGGPQRRLDIHFRLDAPPTETYQPTAAYR